MSKYKLTREETMQYGYTLFNGTVLPDRVVDQYNRVQQRIKACRVDNMPVSEALLNESHWVLNSHILYSK